MAPKFKKHLWLKIYRFNDNKTVDIEYHKIKGYEPDFLIHSDHIFNSNGFQTVMITNKSAETINPLDFTSQYDAKLFKTAIRCKLVADTFGGLQTSKLDITKVLLFVNIGINVVLLYILIKNSGAI